jgi:uncharacterized membrane protein
VEPDRIWNVVTNPAWRPITEHDLPGYVALLAVAGVLVILTIFTYTGSAASSPRRVGTLIALRLLALLLAVVLALRPSAAITEIPKLPSTLIIVVDSSESMSVKDEANFTRWEVVQKMLEKCGPILDQMRDDQQTTIYVYHFSKDFDPERDKFNDEVKPDGKRTEFGAMLSRLYDRHQGERMLRGLIIVSDGADNGTKPALPEASRWRGIGCPVYCFAVGNRGTNPSLKDIGFTSISPDPSPAAIKADIKVKAKVNAPGFEGQRVKIRLKLNDEIIETKLFELTKDLDNEIELTTKAPDTPGEVKVTLELVDPPANQSTTLNDQIETYLTVTREGVRVLVISKDGWELKGIRNALATDKRFDYVEITRTSEAMGTPEDAKAYDITQQRYDVIILGDVSPKMLTSARSTILNEIRDMVRNKGVGFMMTGGAYSLAGTAGIPGVEGWKNTPIADILPVTLPGNPSDPVKDPITFEPTDAGLQNYLLRLNADGKKNREAWDLLNTGYTKQQGYSVLGDPKQNAEVLARANDKVKGPPILVRMDAGIARGGTLPARSLAFAISDTWLWTQPSSDPNNRRATFDLHTRFWKQVVLWLAHQDEVEGNVYVRPEFRRLVVNGRQNVRMGVRDKRGDDVPESDIRYQVHGTNEPADRSKAKRAERDPKGGARVSFDAKTPGEYRVTAWGEGTDPNGEKIAGDASARFVVYPEVSDEMLRPAAQPEFLLALENTANGTAFDVVKRVDRLPESLEKMRSNPPTISTAKPKAYPDWRRDKQKWFLPMMLILFVAVLGVEWGLRRAWGMV